MWLFTDKKKNSNRIRRRREPRRPVYTLQAKAAGRRAENLHKAGVVILLLVAVGGLGWLAFTGVSQIRHTLFNNNQHFVVRHIETSSTGRLTAAHLKEYGGFSEGVNLFELDIGMIKKRLEDVPVIRDVEVQRRLPSTLVVRVNERVPLARIPHGQAGFFFSVDREGRVLGLAGSQFKNLPLVTGISDRGISPGSTLRDTAAVDALHLIRLIDAAPGRDILRLALIDVSNPEYLDVALESGIKVLMPRHVARTKLDDLVVILREAGGRHKFYDLTLDRNIPAT